MIKNIREYYALSRYIEQYHALFYKMWELGVPVFNDSVPTAAIMFGREDGQYMQYVFNPKFWDTLTDYQRVFIICHESLHVILNHGIRTVHIKDGNPQIINICLDIVVNHTLIDSFGFSRKELGEKFVKNLCLVETVFGPDSKVPTDECFEYYYLIFQKQLEELKKQIGGMSSIDDHSGLPQTTEEAAEILGKVVEGLHPSETEGLANKIEDKIESDGDSDKKKMITAGNMGGDNCQHITLENIKKKKKWETVITKWSLNFKPNLYDVEQWARKGRRMFNLPNTLMMPSEQDDDKVEKTRIPVWFFQDTSGSCYHWAKRFFAAAATLPNDRFDVKLHCFDTKVYETDFKTANVYGGGGTTFTCIEQYIQNTIKQKNQPYPKAVFLITDGYGDVVKPEHPNRWYWFMSENYKDCIPKESHIFPLKDYE